MEADPSGLELPSVDSHTKIGIKNPLFKATVGEFSSKNLLSHCKSLDKAFVSVGKGASTPPGQQH